MCGFLKPKMSKVADAPTLPPEELKNDAVTQQKEEEKNRKGFTSTIVTGGMGVTDQANIRKTTLGS
jgi:hypothetical protein